MFANKEEQNVEFIKSKAPVCKYNEVVKEPEDITLTSIQKINGADNRKKILRPEVKKLRKKRHIFL